MTSYGNVELEKLINDTITAMGFLSVGGMG